MFIITLSLAIMSNFYIGYMTCIFVALYFFYYYYSLSPDERNPLGVKFHLAKTIGKMALFFSRCHNYFCCLYMEFVSGFDLRQVRFHTSFLCP